MGLERVRIALLRGFDIPQGAMREDALDWVKEQEKRRGRRQRLNYSYCPRRLGDGSDTAARQALTCCNHFVEQREHRSMTSHVIDIDECGAPVQRRTKGSVLG